MVQMDEELRLSLGDIKSIISELRQDVREMGVQLNNSMERLVKVETLLETQKEDLAKHELRESSYGIKQDERLSAVEKDMQGLHIKIASWTGGGMVVLYILNKFL